MGTAGARVLLTRADVTRCHSGNATSMGLWSWDQDPVYRCAVEGRPRPVRSAIVPRDPVNALHRRERLARSDVDPAVREPHAGDCAPARQPVEVGAGLLVVAHPAQRARADGGTAPDQVASR